MSNGINKLAETQTLRQFGKFSLDPQKKMLWRGENIVPLPLKAIEILCVLIENRGNLVTKDEILKSVWKDTIVEESNLTNNISSLRKTFKDFGESNFIETIPGRGYRFIGEVADIYEREEVVFERHFKSQSVIGEISDSHEKVLQLSPAIQKGTKIKQIGIAFLGIIFLTSGIFALWNWNSTKKKTGISDIKSIAVLPFRSFDEVAIDENLRLRLMDSFITKLGKIDSLSVRPTSSTMKFVKSSEDPIEIGKKLEVDAILEGSIQLETNKLRITLQLVSVKNGEQIWSDQFDGAKDKLLDLQNSVSEKLLAKLDLASEQQTEFTKRPTTNSEAYEEYLKGRYFWNKRTPESLKSAIASFEKAIKLDPNFALAHAGLADVYCVLPEYTILPEKEYYRLAQTHSKRALELDENLAEAFTSLAFVEFWNNKNFAESEKNFRRAIAVNPNYPTAHHWFANVLLVNKNLPEAINEMKAAQKLDPLSLVINTELGIVYYYSRQYDSAIEQFQRTLEIEPNFHRAKLWFGRTLTIKGNYQDALSLYKTLPTEIASDGGIISEIGLINGLTNNRAEAEKQLKVLSSRPQTEKNAFSFALIHLGLGEKETAVGYLKKAALERESDLAYIDVDPIFDTLRENDEFKRIAVKFR
jgi:DNA-binding winged helix-turn-helix (wHTH) protein/TolB-like protein/Tfp pilus assembly protein PilF